MNPTQQKPKPKPPQPSQGGPPSQAPPGSDPFGPAPAGGPAGPSNMDPFGGAMMPGLQGVRGGQGIDPIAAMMGGLGLGAPGPGPTGPPLGAGGLPIGGEMPPPDGDPEMGGSSLLQALVGSLSGDQYTQPPGAPDHMFDALGPQDPNMGVEQILQLLALGQMGVGGGPAPGSLAAGIGPQSVPGQMVGVGRNYGG